MKQMVIENYSLEPQKLSISNLIQFLENKTENSTFYLGMSVDASRMEWSSRFDIDMIYGIFIIFHDFQAKARFSKKGFKSPKW